ncbi:MAG: 50S ribosomal protein L6 [Chlamydiota bacterium]
MSRLGKAPIFLPKEAEVKGSKGEIEIRGPKGVIKRHFPEEISVKVQASQVTVGFDEDSGIKKPLFGLYRSLLNNAITGVTTGFTKRLSLIGVGYRATVKGNILDLQLGFSHPSQLAIPGDIQVAVEKSTLITISGIDKQIVGQFAADVRALRPPEPYKGKGIRYVGEYVRKKAGKSAKGK